VEGRLINVRKLVSLDIVLHGPRFILLEFGIGTPAILVFGLVVLLQGDPYFLGWYLILTGVNYIPLLGYAILAVRRGTAMRDVEADMARDRHYVRRYSTQQFLIFIPFSMLALTLWDVRERRASIGAASL
jgi:hypothetical protein